MNIRDRFKRAWNVFTNKDPTPSSYRFDMGPGYTSRPDRSKLKPGNEQTIMSSICTRIAMDVSQTSVVHARMDENGRYLETIDSGLNRCLTFEANIDQSAKAFLMDIVLTMCDEGSACVVPVDTTGSPLSGSYEIKTMRVGKILQWYPKHVRVSLYNELSGQREEITLPKEAVAIVENPLYPIMNEPNSTLRRLTYKLAMLDAVDEQTSSGKLDLIVQLPFSVRSELRQKQAEERRAQIEHQLKDTKYGIAYVDGTEKVTQLNRPLENNLLKQVEYLTEMLYSQLGMTKGIFDGTASESELNNYYARVIEPIVAAIADAFDRRFITKTAHTQGQKIYYWRDPFKFVTADKLSEMGERFTRNEIMTTNEVRQIIGMKTSMDPKADELRNKNLYYDEATEAPPMEDENQNGGYEDYE